ncbi:MAG: preprotein translocase subunit YajC [Crocinitomix sp.]|nr:preprotein translocase subunit YajC [Crocinitomix sp.]
MNNQFIMLQAEGAEGGSLTQSLIMFGLIGLVFYLFMIRPQMKKTKEAKAFRENIATGDKVVTIGGIHGKVLEISDTTMLISSEGTKFRIEKSSISPNSMDQLGNQKR